MAHIRFENGCRITLEKVSHTGSNDVDSVTAALHEEIELKCFYEGASTLTVEANTVSVRAGDVVVINPYEFHATVDTGKERGKYHLFMLPLDYLSGMPELNLHRFYFGEGKKFATVISGNPKLYGILMEVAEEIRLQRSGSEAIIKTHLMNFFAYLLRDGVANAQASAPEKGSQRLYALIEPALQCMKNEYMRPITAEELAALCKVSKHYFYRTFKAVTNKSPMEYLRDYRLQVADALLSNTDSSIAEIAAHCGFESPNYFSRCYKQRYGKTPREGRAAAENFIQKLQ